MADLESQIRELWERRDQLSPDDADAAATVREAVGLLDSGEGRVAELGPDGSPVVNEWLKQSILLFFKVSGLETIEVGPFEYADRLPLKTG